MNSGKLSTTFKVFGLALGVSFLLSLLPGSALAQSAGAGGQAIQESPATNSDPPVDPVKAATPTHNSTTGHSKPTLSDFAWLEGRWQGAWGPRLAEQVWMSPRAGQMLAVFRVVDNDKTLVIELFSLRQTPDGVELFFRHFTPALVPWEQSGSTLLKLASFDSKTAVFENPTGGEPKRDTFTRIDADTFVSRSEIAPKTGDEQMTEIVYHRQKPGTVRANGGNGGRP